MSSKLFEVTTDDILKLDDIQLRELVAKLVQSDARAHGHSALAVQWGGAQTAADGGFDVNVQLPPTAGYCTSGLPRAITGYQVKKPDMQPQKVTDEMRPNGVLRPMLEDLAQQGGAYIIVSSGANVAAGSMVKRLNAMRQALHDCIDGHKLHVDFFDRRRLADWVMQHPGIVLWVRERVGRALDGWKPYGNWAMPTAVAGADFIVDEHTRIHMGQPESPRLPVAEGVERIRQLLSGPGAAVRIVGLSGVGKTRLVQALFEDGVGGSPLAPEIALYADGGHTPTPSPLAMVTNLVADRVRAVLVIDNCGAALHKILAEACKQSGSLVSLVSVEYDVREDFTAETEVVTVALASQYLIEALLLRHFPGHSLPDRATIAEASGGNARIALAIAGTLGQTGSLGKFADRDLFARLFWQRDGSEDKALLNAAMACSMVYSFQVEDQENLRSNLPQIAALCGQSESELYAHVATLLERQLVQSRGDWRAVLPHALANYLADRATKQFSVKQVLSQLVDGARPHLTRSFVRRLSYIPANAHAKELCSRWLADGGMLGQLTALGAYTWDMFENAATVDPAAALAAVERVASDTILADFVWSGRLAVLLRYIAYDQALFDRCVTQLLRIAKHTAIRTAPSDAHKVLVSFFFVVQSGTHVPAGTKLALLRSWLEHSETYVRSLGLDALSQVLSRRPSHWYRTGLGARQRDEGYKPANEQEFIAWYRQALALAIELFVLAGPASNEIRNRVALSFPPLWMVPSLQADLEATMMALAANQFWLEGWKAVLNARRLLKDDPAATARLQPLLTQLAAKTTADEVVASLFKPHLHGWDRKGGQSLEEWEAQDRAHCQSLGERIGLDVGQLPALLPRLVILPSQRAEEFGKAIGAAVSDLEVGWDIFKRDWQCGVPAGRYAGVIRGFIIGAAKRDRLLVHSWLDACVLEGSLLEILPWLSICAGVDLRTIDRMSRILDNPQVVFQAYDGLRAAIIAPPAVFDQAVLLLEKLAQMNGGSAVALSVLVGWIANSERGVGGQRDRLIPISRRLLADIRFTNLTDEDDFNLSVIAQLALGAPEGEALALKLARDMRDHVVGSVSFIFNRPELIKVLLKLQPTSTLSGLFDEANEEQLIVAYDIFDDSHGALAPEDRRFDAEVLLRWCREKPEQRFAHAARIVELFEDVGSGRFVLAEQARCLLTASPEPVNTLDVIADRIRPSIFSGSLSELIASRAAVLDDMFAMHDAAFQSHARDLRQRLNRLVVEEREWERHRRRGMDESFE